MSKNPYSAIEGEVEAAIEANFDASKKKKPQALDSSGLPKIKGREIQKMKTMKVPPGDPKSFKINGIKWGTGENSKRLAFARQDHFLGVVDAEKNNMCFGAKAPWTQCIALHPSKDIVLSGGMDNATTIWKGEGGKLIEQGKIIEHDGYIASLTFMDGGNKYISAAGDADARIFDLERKTSIVRFCGHDKDCQSLCFARDDIGQKTFATCSSDMCVKLWDVTSGKCITTLKTDSELNSCCQFPLPMTMIACGGEKDKTYLFDIRANKLVSKYARNNQQTASCCFSASGRHLYVGHNDGAIIMWDIFSSGENREYACKISAHTTNDPKDGTPDVSKSRVQNLQLGEDGILASCGFDGKINIWKGPKAA